MRIDARLPLVFGPVTPRDGDHVLTEGADFGPSLPAAHDIDCTCCAPRTAVAGLLGGLFFARARGTVPFFHRLVVHAATQAGRSAVEAALADDPVVSGCFRLG